MHFRPWKRREFITLLGGAACATLWPLPLPAQSPTRPLIGFLGGSTRAGGERYYSGLQQGMRELGYAEGRDYVLDARYADGDWGRLPTLQRTSFGAIPPRWSPAQRSR
jgi:putative ABC transport system substrate-binding protein